MHFLCLARLSEYQIERIFVLADKLIIHDYVRALSGKTFLLFFPESSLRTRITFEKGIKQLGGDCIVFPPEALDKKENARDMIGYIENWADGLIVRHPDFSKIEELAAYASVPVINAMTSSDHPCEILSDLYAIRKIRTNYRELTYTFVGPAGNIARSWIEAAKVLDLQFRHVCTNGSAIGGNNRNYTFLVELEEALQNSDIVLTDSLPPDKRSADYLDRYQITLKRMKMANRHALLNPCPPFTRNEEVSDDAVDSDYFAGYAFKKDLLAVQQAIILYCCGIVCL